MGKKADRTAAAVRLSEWEVFAFLLSIIATACILPETWLCA